MNYEQWIIPHGYPDHCVVSSHIESKLGHLACFDQWDIGKCDRGRGLITSCTDTCPFGTQWPYEKS